MKQNIRKLCVTAVLLALATVLSELVPHIEMPLGGSVTPVSMLPIAMLPILYGTGWGLGAAFVYSVIQTGFGIAEGMLGWGLSGMYLSGMVVFDYILAYTVLGLSGIFRKKGTVGIAFGVAMSGMLRFLCHFISGCIFCAEWSKWDNAYLYSLCYNGAYMLPEIVLTTVAAVLLFGTPQIRRLVSSLAKQN